ncbi:MAG: thioredoxin fold domain-containing protein [Victivallaceae bacterium]
MKSLFFLLVLSVFVNQPCFGVAGVTKKQKAKNSSILASKQAAEEIQWMSYEEAEEIADKEDKYLTLFFTGSDWCIWCKRMKDVIFSTQAFKHFAKQHLCMVEVDFPHTTSLPEDLVQLNEKLRVRYGVTGFPTLIIVDKKGDLILREGFRHGGGEAYVNYLKKNLGLDN